MLFGRHGQNLDAAVREFDEAVAPIRQLEVLRLGPESLERDRVGYRAAVGGDHTQSGGLWGGGRHVRARFCSPGCRAVSAGRFRLSMVHGAIHGAEPRALFVTF